MLAKRKLAELRTWVEIDRSAVEANYRAFRKYIGPRVQLYPVVKSNAYGHGLVLYSKILDKLGVDGLCVDSIVEALRLREEGIKKPILVLGPTLPALIQKAKAKNITLSVASDEMLRAMQRVKNPPKFHVKIDTGMHRQGFYSRNASQVFRTIKNSPALRKNLTGIFTHFASAKDINYQTYTERQLSEFLGACNEAKSAGFTNLMRHCAATGGTLVNKKYHMDAVRIGIGIYGLWPSKELEMQVDNIKLQPVLSWRTVVAEIKELERGDYIGYDLAERVTRRTKVAVLPIGYWHGFPRALSVGAGSALVCGRRARVLGRVSMDLTTIDVTGISLKVGDVVTLIGREGKEMLSASEVAGHAGTVHYEFLTRLNPRMERIVV
jgi:alanine racemase